MEPTLELMLKDISERMQAIGDNVSDDRLTRMIQEQFHLLTQDETIVRKMRFGDNGGERKLVGTKYARWGLSVADVEWWYDVQRSLAGQKRIMMAFMLDPVKN